LLIFKVFVKGFRRFLCNSNIYFRWITFLRQKTPINIIVKYVTFNVANKVIGIDIYWHGSIIRVTLELQMMTILRKNP